MINRSQRRERASMAAVLSLSEQVNDLARRVPSDAELQERVKRAMGAEQTRMEKLVRDVTRVCRVLVDKGLVSREELNRATE